MEDRADGYEEGEGEGQRLEGGICCFSSSYSLLPALP